MLDRAYFGLSAALAACLVCGGCGHFRCGCDSGCGNGCSSGATYAGMKYDCACEGCSEGGTDCGCPTACDCGSECDGQCGSGCGDGTCSRLFGRCGGMLNSLCGCSGCSRELYWNEWYNDPPVLYEPCDCMGHYTGPGGTGYYQAPYRRGHGYAAKTQAETAGLELADGGVADEPDDEIIE